MPERLKAREIRGKPRGRIVDLTGQRFGSLVALRFYGMYRRRTYWLCQCDCGRTPRVAMGNLRGGVTPGAPRAAVRPGRQSTASQTT